MDILFRNKDKMKKRQGEDHHDGGSAGDTIDVESQALLDKYFDGKVAKMRAEKEEEFDVIRKELSDVKKEIAVVKKENAQLKKQQNRKGNNTGRKNSQVRIVVSPSPKKGNKGNDRRTTSPSVKGDDDGDITPKIHRVISRKNNRASTTHQDDDDKSNPNVGTPDTRSGDWDDNDSIGNLDVDGNDGNGSENGDDGSDLEQNKRNQMHRKSIKKLSKNNGHTGNLDPTRSGPETSPLTTLDEDAFTIMMLADICSKGWLLGIFAFAFQMAILWCGPLYVFLFDTNQYGTPLNVPYDVPLVLHVTQFLAIVMGLLTSEDIVTSIHTLLVLRFDDVDWDEMIRDGENDNQNRYAIYMLRIFLPNLLKLIEGLFVLFASFVIAIQSSDAVELLKDFTALFVISRIDNYLFFVAQHGYLGPDLANKAEEARNVKIDPKPERTCCGIPIKSVAMVTILGCLVAGWTWFVMNQVNGTFFRDSHPHCKIEQTSIKNFNDGQCDGGKINTLECAFDGGDCLNYNAQYPTCDALEPFKIGDGNCDEEYNTAKCNFDGSDCCAYQNDERLGDGQCHAGLFNTLACDYDHGDCEEFYENNPQCNIDLIAKSFPFDGPVPILGNGICESNVYNTKSCGYEAGDCILCNSKVYDPTLTGDGVCHGGMHNSFECNNDSGDCDSFNKRFPNCQAVAELEILQDSSPLKSVPIVGDGICNSYLYNNNDCGYEGGDCLECNKLIDDLTKIGDGICNGQFYMSSICDMDGRDCENCPYNPFEIGDGWCNPEYNIPECSHDGTDCLVFNEQYPDCDVEHPSLLGNGICQIHEGYDSEKCQFDGGDCTETSRKYAMKPLSIYVTDGFDLSQRSRKFKGWRLFGSSIHLNHQKTWDVNKLEFFSDEECTSRITVKDENIISSGYPNMYEYFPLNAFGYKNDFFWRGLPDEENNYYIGSTFVDAATPVQCVKFEQKESGMVKIQVQVLTDTDQWINAYDVESIPTVRDIFTLRFSEKLLMQSSQWLQLHDAIVCISDMCSKPLISGNGNRVAIFSWNNNTSSLDSSLDSTKDQSWFLSVLEQNKVTEAWEKVHHVMEIGRESSISIAYDGKRIATIENDQDPGMVKIYQDNGFNWAQVHQEIKHEEEGIVMNSSVSISSTGRRVARGISYDDGDGNIIVYEDNGETWSPIHSRIIGGEPTESIELIAIADDGMRLATLVRQDGIRHIRIYQDNGSTWEVAYQDIMIEIAGENVMSAEFSSNGERVVARFSLESNDNGLDSIRVFEDTGYSWAKVHQDIEFGEEWGSKSITISNDGMVLAISSTRLNTEGTYETSFQVVEDSGIGWTVKKDTIGATIGESFISLSSDGTRFAILDEIDSRIFEFVPHDIALYQSAFQSSVNSNALKNAASYAVDGDSLSRTLTSKEWEPSWRVDLDSYHYIRQVNVIQNGFDEFVLNIYLSGSDDPVWTWAHSDVSIYKDTISRISNSNSSNAVDIGVPNVMGQVVEIMVPGRNVTLSLNEVNVHGDKVSEEQRASAGWLQLHDDINDGENGFQAVAMSKDGGRIIIGVTSNSSPGFVRVFEEYNTEWVQLYGDILGEAVGDRFGKSVSISGEGRRIAVGVPYNDGNGKRSGLVRVFQDNGAGTWDQVHQDLVGEESGDFAGIVSISDDGLTVAIGASVNDGNGDKSGHVRIFYDNGLTWKRQHQDIDGEAAGDRFGSSLSLSGNGSRVAVGARYNDGNGLDAGHVRIFVDNGSAWEQLYGDIDGQEDDSNLGISISLSNDGTRVAIGNLDGRVRVYEDRGMDWMQVHQDLDSLGELASSSLALSSDGRRMAIAAGGYARVFKDNGDAWIPLYKDIVERQPEKKMSRSIAMSSDGTRIAAAASSSVRVYGEFLPANVALYQRTSQSSSYSTASRHAAMNAVDGNLNSTSLTKHEWEPWWRVELDGSYFINDITIFNREDCCQEWLEGVEVNIYQNDQLVWTSPSRNHLPPVDPVDGYYVDGPVDNPVTISGPGPENKPMRVPAPGLGDEKTISFSVQKGVIGNIVEVKISNRVGTLSLADVEVSAEALVSIN